MGDYKVSLEKVEKHVNELIQKYPDLCVPIKKEQIILSLSDDENDPKIQEIEEVKVPSHISYLYLKYKLVQARINKAISRNPEAHDNVNEILLYVKKCKEGTP